jgi:hypothetical protein
MGLLVQALRSIGLRLRWTSGLPQSAARVRLSRCRLDHGPIQEQA